jgi:hypothetical protein
MLQKCTEGRPSRTASSAACTPTIANRAIMASPDAAGVTETPSACELRLLQSTVILKDVKVAPNGSDSVVKAKIYG